MEPAGMVQGKRRRIRWGRSGIDRHRGTKERMTSDLHG
jgi:hypothetical protein